MRLSPLTALLAAAAVSVLTAQQQQPPTFRTGTSVVRVDVTVIDRRGSPVTSLTAGDFDVREDGEPQAITAFKLVEASGAPTDDLSLEIRSPEHAKAEAARDDVRVFLIFWDEYHIEEFRSALYARSGFEKVMMQAFGPTDLVGIMDQLTPTDSIRFSRDRRALSDQIHKMKGRQRVYMPVRSFVEEEHFRLARHYGGVEVIRGDVTRSAIKAAVTFLGTLKEGRKTLIVISESLGPFRDQDERWAYLSDAMRAANDSNTAIYTFDPRGLMVAGRMSELLETLAYGTGGEPLRTNDIVQHFPRVVKQSSAFYLLGYAKEIAQDGKFHEIKVRVKRPGLEVRARSGYWAPRAAAVARAKEIAAESVRPPAVAEAFENLTPSNARHPVDLWAGVTRAAGGTPQVSAAWAPRDGVDVRTAAADVMLRATSGDDVVYEGLVNPEGTSFDAQAGTLQLAFTMRDGSGETVDRVTRTLSVPEPEALSLTTPTIARSRNPVELKAIMSGTQPPIFAGRDFARTDRLLLRFAAQGAEEVTVSARLLTSIGARLVDLPVRRDASRGGYAIDLPLSTVARGEYVIAIDASAGDQRAGAHVAFRVVR